MQRIENADVCGSCGVEHLKHMGHTPVGFGNTFEAIPDFAALGYEIVVRINNDEPG